MNIYGSRGDMKFVLRVPIVQVCAPFLICVFFLPLYALSRQEAAARKDALAGVLDSLDMQKQARKRAGLPIDEIEREYTAVRDSIEALRLEMAELSGKGELPAPDEKIEKKTFEYQAIIKALKNRSLLDWVIFAVGGIAVVSGIVLAISIIRLIFAGGRGRAVRRPRGREYAKTAGGHTASVVQSPSALAGAADINNDDVDSLRQRLSEDIRRIQRFDSGQPSIPESRGQQDKSSEEGGGGESLRDIILKASYEGLNVQQIAKRFHISIDQVALILRVGKQDRRG